MSLAPAFAISSSGLTAHRMRMDVISANLANAQSTSTPGGGPYRRQDVILESAPSPFGRLLGSEESGAMSVRVARVVEDQQPPRRSYDPGHPHADDDGYVAMPNVNPVTELVDLMAATRAYEANVAAVNATKRVLQAALEIGQG